MTNAKVFGVWNSALQRNMNDPRSLRVSTTTGRDATFLVTNPNQPGKVEQLGTTLSWEDAVELATRILEHYAPGRLMPLQFNEQALPDMFVHNKLTGMIWKVVDETDHPAEYAKFDYKDDDGQSVFVVNSHGTYGIAWQDPREPVWTILEQSEIEATTTWTRKL